jgi:hypothetical protein
MNLLEQSSLTCKTAGTEPEAVGTYLPPQCDGGEPANATLPRRDVNMRGLRANIKPKETLAGSLPSLSTEAHQPDPSSRWPDQPKYPAIKSRRCHGIGLYRCRQNRAIHPRSEPRAGRSWPNSEEVIKVLQPGNIELPHRTWRPVPEPEMLAQA